MIDYVNIALTRLLKENKHMGINHEAYSVVKSDYSKILNYIDLDKTVLNDKALSTIEKHGRDNKLDSNEIDNFKNIVLAELVLINISETLIGMKRKMLVIDPNTHKLLKQYCDDSGDKMQTVIKRIIIKFINGEKNENNS